MIRPCQSYPYSHIVTYEERNRSAKMNQILAHFLLLLAHILVVKPVEGNFKLQILHNNDIHGRFAETDENSGPCPEQYVKEKKCFGGFARIKKAADMAKEEAAKKGIKTLFLNAGDISKGTPYNTYFSWRIAADLIDRLGFDAMALGNHEFDDGIEAVEQYLSHIKTPVVCTNIDPTNNKLLELPNFTKSKIFTLEVTPGKKINIGIVAHLTPTTKRKKYSFMKEEITNIRDEARRLRNENDVKIVIALGHSGFELDKKLATEVEEVSLVIGGHTHDFLYTLKDGDQLPSIEEPTSEYPTRVDVPLKNGGMKRTPIVQAYAYGKYLGKLMMEFDDNGNIVEATGNPMLLDKSIPKDEEVEKAVQVWTDQLSELVKGFRETQSHTRTYLGKPIPKKGKFESNFANLITDAFVYFGVRKAQKDNESTWTRTPISFYPNRNILNNLDNKRNNGAITVEDVMALLPSENNLCELTVKGNTIKQFLENSVASYEKNDHAYKGSDFMQFSGLRVKYDLTNPVNERVKSVKALCKECDIPEFIKLDNNANYSCIAPCTVADIFEKLQHDDFQRTELDITDRKSVVKYIKRIKVIAPTLDNRVKILAL